MSSNDQDTDKTYESPKFPRLKVKANKNNYNEWEVKVEQVLEDMDLFHVIKNPAPISAQTDPRKGNRSSHTEWRMG
jgi:hypothetical protein